MTTPIFDPNELSRVAKLAHLQLSDQDRERLGREMGGILSLIGRLQAINTEGVVPLAHPLSAIESMGEPALRLREDRAAMAEARDDNLANAPQLENGLFLVPRVIE